MRSMGKPMKCMITSLRPCLPSDSLTLSVPPLRPSLPSTPRSLRPCLPSVPCLPSSPAFPSAPSLPLSFSVSRATIFLRFTHWRGLKLPPLKGCLWWLWWLLPISFKALFLALGLWRAFNKLQGGRIAIVGSGDNPTQQLHPPATAP
ncbi:hypothetical protein RJT34_28695 [Clitoria ternatea]|uniref:Uncharacterized protein n=1 Tax=Clitoria ternatea TaxID=43366 RepID=A0AAN9FDM7_CLITE